MEPSTIRDHFLTLLMHPAVADARIALTPLLSRPMEGYSLADSQWLWSTALIFLEPTDSPEYALARDYVRAVIHQEGVDRAAAAFLQRVNPRPL